MPGLILTESSDFSETAARNDTNTASNASLVPELKVVPPTLAQVQDGERLERGARLDVARHLGGALGQVMGRGAAEDAAADDQHVGADV
jgi:hypothetical protein